MAVGGNWVEQAHTDEPFFDFVFVHGLSGNSLGTWCPAKEKAWFDDWPLPPFEMPVARVLYYNCELPVFSNAGIEIAANHLLFTLAKDCYETRPLIFICHSLGGVVLQKALIQAHMRANFIVGCTRGIIFLGTPHMATSLDWSRILKRVSPKCRSPYNKTYLEEFSEDLASLSYTSQRTTASYRIINFCGEEWRDSCGLAREDELTTQRDSLCALWDNERSHYTISKPKSVDELQKLLENVTGRVFDAAIRRLDASSRSSNIHLEHNPRTSTWILESSEYCTWRAANQSSLFWLHGSSGSGKTVLSTLIVEALTNARMEQDVVLVYWHEGTSLYEDLAPVLLRSFLGQVIQQRRHMQYNAQFQYLLASIESKPVSISSFLFRHLLRTLLRSLASSDRIFLMIDGLDDGDWVKKQILDVIFESMVQEKRKPQIKCMVSSRAACSQPHNLKKVWELNLDMGEPARRDILIHITGSIKKLSFEFPGCGAVLESIGTEILQRSRGNFLLALLTMEETRLVLSSSRGINHALIDDWPWDISAIYLKMLQSIHSQDILIAKQVFTWLTHAMKPLHISELMEALITGPPANVPAPELFFQRNSTRTYSSEDLINICGGLVTIKSDQTVRFIHHSVREYLLVWHRGKFPHKFYVEISQAHEYLAQICLQHLFDQKNMHFPVPDLHGHWPRVKTPGEKYRFLDYASTYWCEHYRFSETHSTYLPGMLYYCLQKKAWEVETGCPNSPSATSPLYAFIRTFRACTQMGFAAMGQIYLEMGVEVNEIYCSHQGTPLHIAVANGHLDIARLLIKNGACVNAATPELGKTPLHLACSQGDLEMCKFLLENGADKDATTEQYAETSLHLAVVEGHLHVVEHLVETGANINMAVSPTNETPLHLAAAHGRIEECLILLSGITKGRLPDSSFRNKVRDCSRASPMLFEKTQYISYDVFTKYRSAGKRWEVRKATSGSFDSVKMLDIALTPSLPRSWADVEARTQDGWTALHVAAAYGHEMICELLLDSGADFRALTFLGRTALELTIANGHSALASSLVLLWTEAPFDADARLDRSLLAAANSCDRGISRLPNSLKSHYEGSFTNHISRSGQRSPHSGDSEKVDDYSTIFYQPSDSPEELQDQEEWTMLNFSKLMT